MDIFISYRRAGGEILGRLLYTVLKNEGYSVFFDVEEMNPGKFNEQIFHNIDECQVMIVILPSDALERCKNDGDWLRLEIAHGIKKGKTLIPVMLKGFEMPKKDDLPADIADLVYYEAVKADFNFFDSWYERLKTYLEKKIVRLPKPEDSDKKKDFDYDLFQELDNRFHELFDEPKIETRWIDTVLGKQKEEKQAASKSADEEPVLLPKAKKGRGTIPLPECLEEGEDFPESPIPEIVGSVAIEYTDKKDSYTLPLQIVVVFFPDRKLQMCVMRELKLQDEMHLANGEIKRTYIVNFYQGSEHRSELSFLTMKKNVCVLTAAEVGPKGELNIGKSDDIIRYSKAEEVEGLDVLGIAETSESQNDPSPREFLSPYSPEKLAYVLVDPSTKKIIKPSVIKENGSLMIKQSLIPHHTYISVKADEEFSYEDTSWQTGYAYLHGAYGVHKDIKNAAEAFHDGVVYDGADSDVEMKNECGYELGCLFHYQSELKNNDEMALHFLRISAINGLAKARYEWACITLGKKSSSDEDLICAADYIHELLRCGYRSCGNERLENMLPKTLPIAYKAYAEGKNGNAAFLLNTAFALYLQSKKEEALELLNRASNSLHEKTSIKAEAESAVYALTNGNEWPNE